MSDLGFLTKRSDTLGELGYEEIGENFLSFLSDYYLHFKGLQLPIVCYCIDVLFDRYYHEILRVPHPLYHYGL